MASQDRLSRIGLQHLEGDAEALGAQLGRVLAKEQEENERYLEFLQVRDSWIERDPENAAWYRAEAAKLWGERETEREQLEQLGKLRSEFTDGQPLQHRGPSLEAAISEVGPSQVRAMRATERILAGVLAEQVVPVLEQDNVLSPSQLASAAGLFRETLGQLPALLSSYAAAFPGRKGGAVTPVMVTDYFGKAGMRPSSYDGQLGELEGQLLERLGALNGAEDDLHRQAVVSQLCDVYQQTVANHLAIVGEVGPEIIMIRRVLILEDMVRSGFLSQGNVQAVFQRESWDGWGAYVPPVDLEARVKAVVESPPSNL